MIKLSDKHVPFTSLELNQSFIFGGSKWIKVSARTARIPAYDNKVHYFSKTDICIPLELTKKV